MWTVWTVWGMGREEGWRVDKIKGHFEPGRVQPDRTGIVLPDRIGIVLPGM